jgi:hypothetical protein
MSEISSRVLYGGATVETGEADVNGVNTIGYRERVRGGNAGPGVAMKAGRKRLRQVCALWETHIDRILLPPDGKATPGSGRLSEQPSS